MPKSTTILLIRHGEKPESGPRLSPFGQARAQAYSIFFQNWPPGGTPVKFDYLFACEDSENSDRPKLTVKPFSKAAGLDLKTKFKDKEHKEQAEEILSKKKYNNSNILICWHHGKILDLAQDLGVDATKLPQGANWPTGKWPENIFGWVLQLVYDDNGEIDYTQTKCINEQLMWDDCEGCNPVK